MKRSKLSKAVLIVIGIAAVLGLAGVVVMSLWNWLVPALFAGPVLHFWQALGLLVLTRILVGRWAAEVGTGVGEAACGMTGSA